MPPRHLRVIIHGRGRLGGSLARVLRRAGHDVRLVPGRSSGAKWQADAVLLCVPDSAIAQVAQRLAPTLQGRPVVAHCAGALGLEPMRQIGLPIGSLHPLQAVPTRRACLSGYAAVDATSALGVASGGVQQRDLDLRGDLLGHLQGACGVNLVPTWSRCGRLPSRRPE